MLVAGLVLFLFHTGFANEGDYINSWIVQIDGGAEVAEGLARKHGFNNEGQVFYDYVLLVCSFLLLPLLFCCLGHRQFKVDPSLSHLFKAMFSNSKHFTWECIPSEITTAN